MSAGTCNVFPVTAQLEAGSGPLRPGESYKSSPGQVTRNLARLTGALPQVVIPQNGTAVIDGRLSGWVRSAAAVPCWQTVTDLYGSRGKTPCRLPACPLPRTDRRLGIEKPPEFAGDSREATLIDGRASGTTSPAPRDARRTPGTRRRKLPPDATSIRKACRPSTSVVEPANQMANSPCSSVRIRIASSTVDTKIFPSPIVPVRAASTMTETTSRSMASLTSISIRTLATKSTT